MSEYQHTDAHHLASAPVVVGVDGSEPANIALTWGARLAVQRGRGLRIVHGTGAGGLRASVGGLWTGMAPALDKVRTHGTELVGRAEQEVRRAEPAVRISTEVSESAPAPLLIQHSSTAYVVVIGASGTNAAAGHVGSVLLAVTAHAHGTVVVVRTDPETEDVTHADGPVVVGVDGSPASEAAIGAAFEEAAERAAPLVAVHVWSDLRLTRYAGLGDFFSPLDNVEDAETALLAERLAGWQAKYPQVTVDRQVHLADPATALQRWSATAQLLVVGTRGRGRFAGAVLGSTSNSLVQHARCPVMVVHPSE
ncbi:universal stress protein [Nocardia mexicana]|uniref:Nucleotide-binding universal stress UspA family protein n=1 Tax=Nocardia mexicana TaxID=279262 RepID=A0A370HDC1_9NOCA|nr:universal stress protein [Nocardia mexicana]RDI55234.1 nucleotide-binding universal stress UspA family protein [Nocardia mexicana]